MSKPRFTQEDYNALTAALDNALAILQGIGLSDADAEKMLSNFVSNHYLPVWRAMHGA